MSQHANKGSHKYFLLSYALHFGQVRLFLLTKIICIFVILICILIVLKFIYILIKII